ncbi:MAG: M48 family metalloprotease [Acidobacteria bacterium]|nr:M48 family metalloprotease [Acidobacteriota bacterium]
MSRFSRVCRRRTTSMALVMTMSVALVSAQTRIVPPKNKYSPEEDVKLGREAAAEVRQEYPIIEDRDIDGYLDELGRRLVAVAPADLKHPAFEYSFTPVNLKEINAFALPGGPMFVNRGMFTAASAEGEVIGVMAHELAHVLLRHGTANATKAQGFQLGALAGAIAGAVIGGGWGQAISQGSQFGLGTWLLKYSRDYEKQADLLGAQIMARAGYDPRDLARMFETIQKESSGAPPQWLSSHPNPGNRSQYIAEEAAKLSIANRPDQSGFARVKARFDTLPAAKSMSDAGRNTGGASTTSVGTIGQPVPPPARNYRTARGGQLFQVSVPTNWTAVSSNSAVKFVPQNAYGEARGQVVLTHGVELGVARASSRDLRQATETLVRAFMEGNPEMRVGAGSSTVRLSGRTALATPLIGRSALGGNERVGVYTTFLADGNLFYYLTVVPDDDAAAYQAAFDRVGQSIRLTDR